MPHVLVICTANRGRSPTTEALLRLALADEGLDGQVTVASAGVAAHELDRTGMPADPATAANCLRHGIDLSAHVAQPVTRALVEEADLLIVMERWQEEILRTGYPGVNVHTLRAIGGEPGDLADTAGVSEEKLESFYQQADRALRDGLRHGPLADVVRGGGAP